MNTLQILKQARDLISNERHWTRFVYSTRVGSFGKAYCAVGAVAQVMELGWPGAAHSSTAVHELALTIGQPQNYIEIGPGCRKSSVATYNNSHTHKEVLKMFDDTITRLSAVTDTNVIVEAENIKELAAV